LQKFFPKIKIMPTEKKEKVKKEPKAPKSPKAKVVKLKADFPQVTAIILCAGTGSRSGLKSNKILHMLGTKSVVEKSIDAFVECSIARCVLVANSKDLETLKEIAEKYKTNFKSIMVVEGGKTRTDSVKEGLKFTAPVTDIVAIHDGARPFVTKELILKTIVSSIKNCSGVLGVPSVDTLVQTENGKLKGGLDRDTIYQLQTPQTFSFSQIKQAYEQLQDGESYTDDAQVFLKAGFEVHIVKSCVSNKKMTVPSDFVDFDVERKELRIGTGFDVHRLVKKRLLVLGGVKIPYSLGLDGHSDADVVSHAIMDALLSGANLPDIGVFFPDNNKKFKDANSVELLKIVAKKLAARGYIIKNISAVIMAQRPKLSLLVNKMANRLSAALDIDASQITISCTTTEQLGIVGKGKGMAASATALLEFDANNAIETDNTIDDEIEVIKRPQDEAFDDFDATKNDTRANINNTVGAFIERPQNIDSNDNSVNIKNINASQNTDIKSNENASPVEVSASTATDQAARMERILAKLAEAEKYQ